ncbi:MAG TPA: hypothetical protein VFN55_12855 [Solirubrobacteraceae bacterium]|nr:hypothetical protein [Solirubrobacteraceae bacterium]
MTNRLWRTVGIVSGLALATLLVVLYLALYLTSAPGTAAATTGPQGTQMFLGTVPAAALNDAHPTWVSYYAVDPQATHWRHDTTYQLPAHTLVKITIYNYDSQTGLRNPFISQATGTVGGTFGLDGKPTQHVDPDTASHIFAIPQLGVSVPIVGIADTAKNPCSNAPCSLSQDHTTTTFTIRTPGPGLYRWQCLVPCAAGFIEGWGGPMQTVGYMDGYIKVV